MQYAEPVARVLDHIRAQYGAQPEYLWVRLPKAAALRHAASGKWFAALMLDMPRSTLRLPGEGCVDILNLKCDPLLIASLVDGAHYLPAYHMNKQHWISLVLDGSIPFEEVCSLVDLSYGLISRRK